MISFQQKIGIFCIFGVLLASTQGCDKVEELTKRFTGQETDPVQESFQENQTAIPTPPPVGQKTTDNTIKNPKPLAKNVLATVGDWSITIDEFKERLKALKEIVEDYDETNVEQNKMVLEELINQQLIVQEAEKRGIAKNKDIVDAVEEFRRTLVVREMAAEIVKEAAATPEDAQAYYDENKQEFVAEAQWRVREIVVKDEQEAKNILIELYQGADFEEMVKAHSKAKSAWKKGDLGFKTAFDFPKMQNVVAALGIGETSAVFKGPDGFYIVKLEEKKGGEPLAFEDVKEDIIQGLSIYKQRQKINETLQELRNNTVVNINDKLLEE